MTPGEDLAAVARSIVDANRYMTLGTADADGSPWVSPVWFAPVGYREFLWVSAPETRHSRNLAARPQLAIVIFDSQAPISTGRGVYLSAHAEELSGDARERGIVEFSRRSEANGGRAWTLEDVVAPARLRLYRATAYEHFVQGPADERTRVELA